MICITEKLNVINRLLLCVLLTSTLIVNAQNQDRMETETLLTLRQLSLVECACIEAQGDMERLDVAIRKALDNGVSVNELKEAFSQLYAYTGFPRSLNALNKYLMSVRHKAWKTMRAERGNVLPCGTMQPKP